MPTLRPAILESALDVMEPLVSQGVHHLSLNPTCPISVRYLVLRPPACVRPRRHAYIEILVVQSGGAALEAGGNVVELHRGDICLIPEDVDHRVAAYLSRSVKVVALYFLPRVIFGDGGAEESRYLEPLRRSVPGPLLIRTGAGTQAEVHQTLRRIHALDLASGATARLAAKTYLKLILVQLLEHADPGWNSTPAGPTAADDLRRLQPLFDYLDHNYARSLTVEQAARMLDMSQSHFMRKFRAVTGGGLITYLNGLRIARAKQLIATTESSLASIGLEVGFCDQSYFGAVFRRMSGVTPTEFRNQAGHRATG